MLPSLCCGAVLAPLFLTNRTRLLHISEKPRPLFNWRSSRSTGSEYDAQLDIPDSLYALEGALHIKIAFDLEGHSLLLYTS